MQPIPQKVKNVNVYPYIDFNGGGVGPVIPPVLTDAEGTYAVGSLIRSLFYNLNLSGGESHGSFKVHDLYFAVGEFENGSSFRTPPMYCTEAGASPEFGRTVTALTEIGNGGITALSTPNYVTLGPLTDISVTMNYPAPIILSVDLIENGSGNIIATRIGTPHLMGVEVTKGNRVSPLKVGMKNIMITGKQKDGKTVTFNNLTCVNAGETAVFIHEFPEN